MPAIDERAELAPRDIVTRAIDSEIKHLNAECIYPDINHKSSKFIKSHFPNIYQKLISLGIDSPKRQYQQREYPIMQAPVF